MLRLIQFELSKIVKSKFFRILSLFLLLFLIAYYIYIYINTVRLDDVVSNLQTMVDRSEQQVQAELDAYKQEKGDAAIPKELQLSVDILGKEKYELNAYENEDWTALFDFEIDRMRSDLESLIMKREYYTSSWPTLFTQETRRAQLQWMIDKKLEPVLPIDRYSWRTIYDLFYPIANSADDERFKEFIISRSSKQSSSGIFFMNHVVNLLFSIFGTVFFILLFGDVVTKEGLGRNGSIHLLRTQPIHRDSIMISKFLSVLLISALFIIGIGGVSVLLGVIFDRVGDWEYPVLVYGEDYAYEFINMGTFLIKSALLFYMAMLFSYSLLFLFSIAIKRMIISMGLTLITILLGMQLAEQSIQSSIAPYIPFHYLSTPQIVTMEFGASLKNFDFTYENGMLVLGAYSILLIIIAYILSVLDYKKRI